MPVGLVPKIGVLVIVISIEQNLNRVGVGEAAVAAILGDDDVLGPGIEADDADIKILIVVCKTDIGPFGGGRPFVRLLLDETGGRLDLLPDRLVDEPVQHRRRVDAASAYSSASLLALLWGNGSLGRSDTLRPGTAR